MKLGEKQVLTVVKTVDFGVYLGSETERVLLPKKQVPTGIEVGDPIEVFLYKDSDDRIIATTREPKLTLGKLAVLEVADTNRMGAFLDWGLEKDLFLPFRQQTTKVKKGDRCLCTLYIDKSERLCATMKVYHMLRTDSPYQKDDHVQGIIYDTSEEFGVFVAVDNCYSARIPKKDVIGTMKVGDWVEARVTAVKEDGKLDLSVRKPSPRRCLWPANSSRVRGRILLASGRPVSVSPNNVCCIIRRASPLFPVFCRPRRRPVCVHFIISVTEALCPYPPGARR